MHLHYADTDMPQHQMDAPIDVSAADAHVATCIDELGAEKKMPTYLRRLCCGAGMIEIGNLLLQQTLQQLPLFPVPTSHSLCTASQLLPIANVPYGPTTAASAALWHSLAKK